MRWCSVIRKSAKWGAFVFTVLLAIIWLGSTWWTVKWVWNTGSVGVGRGEAWLAWASSSGATTVGPGLWVFGPGFIATTPIPFAWGFKSAGTAGFSGYAAPLWLPVLLVIASAVMLFRWDSREKRRARAGECLNCGYNRAGLSTDDKCPECGRFQGTSA